MNALPNPSPPPIPERTAHDLLCDRADLFARAMYHAFPDVPITVACYLQAELVRVRAEKVPPTKARFFTDIYEHFARTDTHYGAITALVIALNAIATSMGLEVEL
jgi:hypothetical protein